MAGFEPTTLRVWLVCSTAMLQLLSNKSIVSSGLAFRPHRGGNKCKMRKKRSRYLGSMFPSTWGKCTAARNWGNTTT